MIKRFFCALLTAVICFTSSMVIAVNNSAERKNIYTYGGFDTMEDIRRCSPLRSKLSFEQDKAKSGDGCAKITSTSTWPTMRIPISLVKGETYDISFDYMTDNEPAQMRVEISDDTNKLQVATGTFSNDWNTCTFTYKCAGIGKATDEQLWNDFSFRMFYGTGQNGVTMYMDNFSVIPHGDVKADYSHITDPNKAFREKLDLPEPKNVTVKSFDDIRTHWAKDTVETLATYGYIDGMDENAYAPDQNVTRAQFVKMMLDGATRFDMVSYDDEFSDISGEEWYADYISTANKFGLLGSELTYGGMFYPERAITRVEAASIASKIAKIKKVEKGNTIAFLDMDSAKPWEKNAVQDAAGYGLITGYEDGRFLPDNTITRAEAAQILYRIAEFSTKFAIYVDSEKGDDDNNGTINAPLATIYAAKDMVSKYNKNMKNNIEVKIRGEHYLENTLEFNKNDSGTNGYDIIYTNWGDVKPTITMGRNYYGFTPHDSSKNIYKVYVGMGINTRQAYFNDKRGVRARSVAGMKNPELIDKAYYLCDNVELLDYQHPEDLELQFILHWHDQIAVGNKIEMTDDGRVKVTPGPNTERWNTIAKTSIMNYVGTGLEFPAYFENAYELLDAKGEWYMNTHDGYMYYIPRDGEDMSKMELTIPVGEEIIKISGTDSKNPVHNLVFDNLEICETGWLWPSYYGNLGWQNWADHYDLSNPTKTKDAPGAVTVSNGYYIDFTNNDFTRMGSVCLNMLDVIKYCDVIGNEFYNSSSKAVQLGGVFEGALSKTSLDWVEHCRINNNYIHDNGLDYKGTGAISTGWIRHSEINHNEVANTYYSSMHIGWGWQSHEFAGTDMYDVKIQHNFLQEAQNDRLYDGAHIYTLGASSYETEKHMSEISYNYLVNQRNLYPSLYPDEGSTGWHFTKNVIDNRDVLVQEANWDREELKNEDWFWYMIHSPSIHDNVADFNYSTTEKVRINENAAKVNKVENNYTYPDANWPDEAQSIIENAGVEKGYQENFEFDGPKYFIARQRTYNVPKGEKVKMDLKVTGRYLEEYDISDFDINYYISNPDVLEIEPDGTMKAIGSGYTEVMVTAEVGGRTQIKQIRVYAGEEVAKAYPTIAQLNMISGNITKLGFMTETNFGNKLDITNQSKMTYTSLDTSVVTVENDGTVTAVGLGETTIRVTCSYQDETYEVDVPVNIIDYGREDSVNLPFVEAPSTMFSAGSWTGGAKISNDGKGIIVKGSPVYFDKEKINNKLIAFDMKVSEDAGSWPSITFGSKDRMDTYNDGDVYLIGFKENIIELQRFNKGVRTMVFGDAEYMPIGGPGVPNSGGIHYKPGETCSVVAGILEEENGTRIVLTINGVNVFDYTDTSVDRVSANGYFGIYESTGSFEFSPYTGITK